MLEYPFRIWPVVSEQETITQITNPAVVNDVRRSGAICLGAEYRPYQFAYSALFQGGNFVVEQGWPACSHYPRYVPPGVWA